MTAAEQQRRRARRQRGATVTARYTYQWCVAWGNPYTSPPAGRPRELLRMTTPTHECPTAITAAAAPPGNGYAVCFQRLDSQPPRRISQAGRASIRRANLTRRTLRKLPLFAAQVIAEQLAARPDYFAGLNP